GSSFAHCVFVRSCRPTKWDLDTSRSTYETHPSANPLFELRRLEEDGWFDHYAASFDAVWDTAKPWSPESM
ncbi:hypothetical protein PV416_43735, partial [Streptomyces ipomoeae]|nr:hypothetical protein [Streptomyces ipomoeae]MDX2880338.1 hypothetical protein [Streptomyces ipomoeae]